MSYFESFCCDSVLERSKLWKLYSGGIEKVEKQLDVVKIVRRLQQLKIITNRLLQRGIINPHEISFSQKYVINLSGDEEEDQRLK